MKWITLFITLLSMASAAKADQLIWVTPDQLTSYRYDYGKECDSFTMGIKDAKYKFSFCSGQYIVQDEMKEFLLSPQTVQCVKSEVCYGGHCRKEYGVREESVKILLLVEPKGKIDSYQVKRQIGDCR